jgi:hypothetical protein
LYFVNHKVKELQIDPYAPKTRYLPFLKIGEKLMGGRELIFQSFNAFMLSSGAKIDEKDPIFGPDINGWIANAMFVKNKFNIEGAPFPMVFDQATGYSPVLSDFMYLYERKFGLSGTSKITLDILPEVSFSRKELVNLLYTHPAVGRAIQFETRYRASAEMLNGIRNPTPLLDLGTNVPMEKRVGIIMACTQSYHSDWESGEEWRDFLKLGLENRKYYVMDASPESTQISYINSIINDPDITRVTKGYSMVGQRANTPFDVDRGLAKSTTHGGITYIEQL